MGNFFEDGVVGKVQHGPSWWFLDTPDGITEQLNALSQVGLFSHFIGMVTDSRSFLSFTRHDYFRRVVCNMIGEDVRRGLISKDIEQLKVILEKIFYTNALQYIKGLK
jgi:glucuronate isomerase